ncbi:MAG: class I SAM-dependent methyltransferase [Chloroflexi bacterium]|nr:class I SAM-dependent methyltransferase [Chloroflexota bacterium]
MERLDKKLLTEMAQLLAPDERDEMAIPSYLHPNPLLRWMAWRRIEVLAREIVKVCKQNGRAAPKRTIMDYGCGTGALFPVEVLQFAQVYGVDIVLDAAQLLVEKKKYQQVHLCSPKDAAQEIPNHSLDVIVAAEVLEHISPLTSTLDLFWQKLRPDGKLLITVPTENRMYRFGRRLSGFRKHFHVDQAASIHTQIGQHRFDQPQIEKIPWRRPFDIYWLISYTPTTS